ncbi:protein tyrosine kinase [Aureococcus anophagefferens]|uniref:Protein tyrosine kinase n=1 Tax=Aureococcus anophagefferens TaxID=44056 RepID=A0ABR1FIW2_AURAN
MSDVLDLLERVGSALHASGVERAVSTRRVAEGRSGPPAQGDGLDRARKSSDDAWRAARGGELWGAPFELAFEALATERFRVDRHAGGAADYYAVVSGYSAFHERLLRCLRDAARASGAGAGDVAFGVLFLKGKELAAAQRGYGVGALGARSFPAGARAALLATMGGAEAVAEAILLFAPDFVDAAALGALLAPPREYAVLASRLLTARSGARSDDVGFGRSAALSASRFMDVMTRWINDLRLFELDLGAALGTARVSERRGAAAAASRWWCSGAPAAPRRPRGAAGGARAAAAAASARRRRPSVVVGRPRNTTPGLEKCGGGHFDAEAVELRETVGSGASGTVRRGLYKGTHDVAVKLVFEDAKQKAAGIGVTMTPKQWRSDFDREVAALRRVDHPNIVTFFGVFDCPEFEARGVVLEFLPGGSLDALLRAPAALDTVDDVALALADGVANGMAHLHGLGLLHRDLKPANVLLDASGVAKVSDFGLCCVSGHEDGATIERHAHTGVTGTLRWMAPEVLCDRPYSFAADVYSFAILLWQLLAWHGSPFDEFGQNVPFFAVSVAEKHHRPALKPCEDRGAPPALVSLLPAAWAPEPEARPTFDDICAAIDAARADFGDDGAAAPPRVSSFEAAEGAPRSPPEVVDAAQVAGGSKHGMARRGASSGASPYELASLLGRTKDA